MTNAFERAFTATLARVAPTPRERALLAVLLCAVMVAALVEAAAFAVSARSRALDAATAQQRTRAAIERGRDPTYRAALESSARQARAWSFDDATWDIAAVRAQTDIDAMARAAGLDDVRVGVAPAARPGGALRLTLESAFTWESLGALLLALSQSTQSYSVEGVEVDEEQASLRLEIRAVYIKPGVGS
jgi:hypothetical protein